MLMRYSLFILVAFTFIFSACAPKHADFVVAKIGDEKITMNDFETAYLRTAGGVDRALQDSIEQYKNFLHLYVNYRMKLKDAIEKGFDNKKELQEELINYKNKIGRTYLLEKEIYLPGMQKLYDQRKYELRVSHIMIRPDSLGEEPARLRAEGLLKRIKAGESFEEIAKQYSDDTFSKPDGGDIYWITAGIIVPVFENAAYSTPINTVHPEVVKTPYGFHLIKVTDRRNRITEIKAAHILVDFVDVNAQPDTAGAFATMDTIVAKLKAGEDFAELAKQYSDDTYSKPNGGDLGFFSRRMMVKEFDEAAFNLKNVGDVSAVTQTMFGLHLIKLLEVKPFPTFDEERENLRKLFQQTRYDEALINYVAKLKNEFGFEVNKEFFNTYSNLDSAMANETYFKSETHKKFGSMPVFTIDNKSVIFDTVAARISADLSLAHGDLNLEFVSNALNKIKQDFAIETKVAVMEKSFPEFAALMEEYRNGIYIFKLQEDEVWGKVVVDSLTLYNYWSERKNNYGWEDRVGIQEIYSTSDSLIKVYHAMVVAGESFDSVAVRYSERSEYKFQGGRYPLIPKNSSELHMLAWDAPKIGYLSEPIQNDGGWVFIKVLEKDPARLKTFEEARAEVSGAYQEELTKRLEEEYITRLVNRFKPEFFYDKLEKAFRSE